MSTANLYILPKPLLSDEGKKQQSRIANQELSTARAKAETEPEKRLWKVCAEVASPRLDTLEWITFLLFAALVLATLACCLSELFRLVNGRALDETVRAFLTR